MIGALQARCQPNLQPSPEDLVTLSTTERQHYFIAVFFRPVSSMSLKNFPSRAAPNFVQDSAVLHLNNTNLT